MKKIGSNLLLILSLLIISPIAEARMYDAAVGRFLTEDPIGFEGGDINLYSYVGQNPTNYTDPLGLSSIIYNNSNGSITIVNGSRTATVTFPASNNASSTSNGSFPAGTYNYSYYVPHSGAGANSSYGSYGNFVFDVDGRTGMGVHSGRADSCDLAGRCGVQYTTEGCIRTTDNATELLRRLQQNNDPLTAITVIR